MRKYEAGNLDSAGVPVGEIDRAKADPVLSDVRVRRALSIAIDRKALVENVLKGGQEPAQWFCRPGLTVCPTPKDYPDLGVKFNPEGAKKHLVEEPSEH